MSNLKFSSGLFLDNLELNRFNEFIFENGWEEIVRQKTESWGIVKNDILDYDFNSFRISQSTPISGNATIQIQTGTAIAYDQALNRVRFIKNNFISPIPFPQDGNWYWVKIAPKYSSLEVGKVTIDTAGNLTGVGTAFTEVLRGQPDFPSRIKFYKLQSDQSTYNPSMLNALEYDVLQVVSDTQVILQGTFQNEIDLYYTVQGTFTSGYIVPFGDSQIFQYDDCSVEFVQESTGIISPLKPTYVLGQEFFIYRVRYDSGNLIIQDYRNEIYKTREEFDIEYIGNDKNPLIGVEKIRYNSDFTPLDKNLVTVGWGFRSNSYTINGNLDKITITGGNGGKFKNANAFSTGNFDGWRLYFDYVRNNSNVDSYSIPEKYCLVKSSVKNGTSIDLFLDRLSLQDFIPITYSGSATYLNGDRVNNAGVFYILLAINLTGVNPTQSVYSSGITYTLGSYTSFGDGTYQSLTNSNLGNQPDLSPTNWVKIWQIYTPTVSIVPDVESVLLEFNVGADVSSTVSDSTINRKYSFDIKDGCAEFETIAVNDSTVIVPIYNVKYSYKNHKVYSPVYPIPSDVIGYTNESGSTIPYSSDIENAFIKVTKNINAYSNFKDKIDLGDNFGVVRIPDIEAFIAPLPSRTFQLTVGDTKQNVEFTGALSTALTGDVKINLPIVSTLLNPLKSGNRFYLYFNTQLDNNNDVGSSVQYKIQIYQNTTTLLYEFTQDELTKGQQFFILTYESSISSGTWQIVHFDKDYNGDSAHKPGSEAVDISTNIETVSGKNILVVSGYYETILISNSIGGSYTIDGIRTLNGKTINNLKLINKSVTVVTLSDYSTYASPGTGVLRFSFGYSGNVLRNINDCIGFSLDNTNRAYVKLEDSVTVSKMDFFSPSVPNFDTIDTSGDATPLSPALTYTIPPGPKRLYTIRAHATFQKDGTSVATAWFTGMYIVKNGTTFIHSEHTYQFFLPGGTINNYTNTLVVIAMLQLVPGDVIELKYSSDFDFYHMTGIHFEAIGIAGEIN